MVEAIFAFYHVGTFLPGRVELSTFAFSTTFYHDMETQTVVAGIIMFYPALNFPRTPMLFYHGLPFGTLPNLYRGRQKRALTSLICEFSHLLNKTT
jgi:hypothetical protein